MEGNKCANLECDFCVKGKIKKFCIIGGEWEHQFGIDARTGQLRKDLEFLSDTYSCEEEFYDCLPQGFTYGVCRQNYCLYLLSVFRKITFVLQCIKEGRNAEHFPQDKEIERKVIFYYAEARHQRGGIWECDVIGCRHSNSKNCWEKSNRYYTEELSRLDKTISAYRLFNYPFCFCWSGDWWNSFLELYDRIMNFEKSQELRKKPKVFG